MPTVDERYPQLCDVMKKQTLISLEYISVLKHSNANQNQSGQGYNQNGLGLGEN